ncbi:hypothetical protein [Candidatus Amoebophilus asiaticus]|nr:hypothetical protein [Candidatus Amoebophilus asiaticus]
MTRYLIMLVITFILISCGDPYKVIYGRWQIYKYESAPISALTDEEATGLLGEEFTFSKDYIIIGGIKIEHPSYKFREEKANDYFYINYRMPKEFICIEQEIIKILELGIDKSKLIDYKRGKHRKDNLILYIPRLIFYENELIFYFDGVFFYLKKIK